MNFKCAITLNSPAQFCSMDEVSWFRQWFPLLQPQIIFDYCLWNATLSWINNAMQLVQIVHWPDYDNEEEEEEKQ